MPTPVDLSIIIVVFHNDDGQLRTCIDAVTRSSEYANLQFEVILVLNGGPITDDLRRRCVVIDFHDCNRGFAVAVNEAVSVSSGETCLILNPDALVNVEAIQEYRNALAKDSSKRPSLIAGVQFVDGNLQTDAYFVWFFSLARLIRRRSVNERLIGQIESQSLIEVDKLPGSSLYGRKKDLKQLGPFDESFFLYGEDVDMSIRARHLGWNLWLSTGVVIEHEGASSHFAHGVLVERARTDAALRLVRKHLGPISAMLAAAELLIVTLIGAIVPNRTSSRTRRARLARVPEIFRFVRGFGNPSVFRDV